MSVLRRSRPVVAAAGVLLVAALLGACGSDDGDETVVGTWGEDAEGEPFLEFVDDGTVSGSDGCNRLTGEWTRGGDDDDDVLLGPLASTQMACEGVDTWLSQAVAADVDDNRLVLEDDTGREIGTLSRAS